MRIKNVAVIGPGIIGAAIAAQCANAGLRVCLLDQAAAPADRCALPRAAIARQLEAGGFMAAEFAANIEIGNLEDDLDKLAAADWIIEAVVEDLQVKRPLYARLDSARGPTAAVSSASSTFPLSQLTEGRPAGFRRHFMLTHFFNPPRERPLLELIAGPDSEREALQRVAQCADRKLGLTVARCQDTPGFIAHRIGMYWLMLAVHAALEFGLRVEEADALLGKAAGFPKSGVFGLCDALGIGLWPQLAGGMIARLPATDPMRAIAAPPAVVQNMIEAGHSGFYLPRAEAGRRGPQVLDLQDGQYRAPARPALASLAAGRNGLRALLEQGDRGGRYALRVLSRTLAYAAALIPAVADDIQTVDKAMRGAYGWRQGPFELLDAIGPAWLAERLAEDGQAVPELLQKVGRQQFYRESKGVLRAMDGTGRYRAVRPAEGMLLLADRKRRAGPLCQNRAGSLWDIGRGVTCLEFHTKMNALQPESMAMIQEALAVTGADFRAMVIYNDGPAFSAGADLSLMQQWLQAGAAENIEALSRAAQAAFNAIKFSPFPVVAATAGLALGGGCEVALHCAAIQAHAETRAGLVEKNVGLVPGWGGCKEMILRHGGRMETALPLIARAKISASAAEARLMRILRPGDRISMNRARLLADARARALALSRDYQAPAPATIELLQPRRESSAQWIHRQFSAYDRIICEALSGILAPGTVTESELSRRELAAFMQLSARPETRARIECVLKTGKPLRN